MSTPPSSDRPRHPLPTSNPLPLSPFQESRIREQYYSNVRALCADYIRAYADCTRGKTFSMAWRCKEERNRMNECMLAHATAEERDRAREEWWGREVERRERKEVLRRREEDEERVRERERGVEGEGQR